jgi:hypothetical protein
MGHGRTRTRLRDGTPIALFRRNAFGYSDNLSLSNFKLPQKFTAKPDDSSCHGTQEASGMGFGGRFHIDASAVTQESRLLRRFILLRRTVSWTHPRVLDASELADAVRRSFTPIQPFDLPLRYSITFFCQIVAGFRFVNPLILPEVPPLLSQILTVLLPSRIERKLRSNRHCLSGIVRRAPGGTILDIRELRRRNSPRPISTRADTCRPVRCLWQVGAR